MLLMLHDSIGAGSSAVFRQLLKTSFRSLQARHKHESARTRGVGNPESTSTLGSN